MKRAFVTLFRTAPVLLVILLAAGGVAAGLRLLPPAPQGDGVLQLTVLAHEGAPLTPVRAALIAALKTTNLRVAMTEWAVVDGVRIFADGVLRIECQSGGEGLGSPLFFAAREGSLPPEVTVSNAAGLRSAVAEAKPGSRILLAAGTYPGGFYFSNVRGEANLPIVIAGVDPQNPPVIQGGGNGMQFSDAAWIELRDLVFVGATGNGLNIDDGGTFETPSRQVFLHRLRISDVGPNGNRDAIKLSGVVDFRIEGCTLERWGTGGSGVDLVGCHGGIIESNVFRHGAAAASGGANGVQTKGGSRNVVVRRNRFESVGARAVNIGGSTGLEFFRPPLEPDGQHAEARDIRVEGNTFLGSTAPIAFVGVDGARVRFNTIYRPGRWAIRILQETTAPGFVACRNGQFSDNIVVFHSDEWSSGGVNIGPNTAPLTFQFTRNWWYCLDDPARSRPVLPVTETGGVYGQSPQFRDAANGDLRLEPGSPALGFGAEALPQ